LGENHIEVALQKLNQLTLVESQAAAAQILKHTDGLVQDMRKVKDGEEFMWLVARQLLSILPSRWKGVAW
jgi:hypothetical protein